MMCNIFVQDILPCRGCNLRGCLHGLWIDTALPGRHAAVGDLVKLAVECCRCALDPKRLRSRQVMSECVGGDGGGDYGDGSDDHHEMVVVLVMVVMLMVELMVMVVTTMVVDMMVMVVEVM